ncbi:hypothetical protein IU405_00880, partial [Polaribacter sp. BAL334]|uniref:hypothetical protein n=1 Tax=Polaribacter sp. BAL334 TaxID=1708178 RepID=UPI0018D200F7
STSSQNFSPRKLSILVTLLFIVSFSFSQQNNKPYLFGVPPAPPFQKADVTISIFKKDGCTLAKKKMIGYVINIKEEGFSDYELLIQDEKGVRHKCYIDTDLTSNYDLSMLKYTLIPGNKVEMKVKYCGSGGYIYVLQIKNLKRN